MFPWNPFLFSFFSYIFSAFIPHYCELKAVMPALVAYMNIHQLVCRISPIIGSQTPTTFGSWRQWKLHSLSSFDLSLTIASSVHLATNIVSDTIHVELSLYSLLSSTFSFLTYFNTGNADLSEMSCGCPIR